MEITAGTFLGPYEVVATIGAGGMGEVYRALDTRLGREVALKVLPQSLALDEDRLRRFEQEARAASALDHPNVVAVHDIGTHLGTPYIVMELLEGETLRDKLISRFPPQKAIDYAVHIAAGLAAAHGKGIIHRDLKPENIFITRDDRVKILDFGLAKLRTDQELNLSHAVTTPRDTKLGAVFGTISYMSPEQVRGEPVDARSDIFSFGTILHEMLSGSSPFQRASAAETMTAILRDEAPPIPAGRSLHPGLLRVVSRCLGKNVDERFQSARDLAFALQEIEDEVRSGSNVPGGAYKSKQRPALLLTTAIAIAATLAAGILVTLRNRTSEPAKTLDRRNSRETIVVLPFENLGDPTDAYFAAGLTEEIISRLAAVRDLGVISRTTAIEYNRKGKTVKQIGQDLGVDYLLEGTVRWDKAGNRVRINPQLIRVADDTHLWADGYDRQFEQIFEVQSDIAEQVLQKLDVTLGDREKNAIAAIPTHNLEAYRLYLRAQSETQDGSRDLRSRISLLQRAVRQDPKFAVAHAVLGSAHSAMYHHGYDRTPARLIDAKANIDMALSIDPDLPEGRRALGEYYYWGFLDYARALEQFELARRLRPNDSELLKVMGAVRRRQGRFEEALRLQLEAQRMNPHDSSGWQESAYTYKLLRRPADADRLLVQAITISPEKSKPYRIRVDNLWSWKGPTEEARQILEQMPDAGDEFATLAQYEHELLGHRFDAALERLKSSEHSLFHFMPVGDEQAYLPRELLLGQTYVHLGDLRAAKQSFNGAVVILEAAARAHPDNARIRSALGLAYAGLGRQSDAVREGEHAVRMYPVSRDALSGTQRLTDLARIYATLGEQDKAIDLLQKLLAMPSFITLPILKHDPAWDPLRDHARFRALVAG